MMKHRAIGWKFFKAVLWTFFCTCFIATASDDLHAATRSANGIASVQGKDPTYFYMDIADAKEMAMRLRKSELIRFLVDLEPDFSFLQDILRDFPSEELTLMVVDDEQYDFSFQMVLNCGERHREILKKIEDRTAKEADVLELFGRGNLLSEFLEVMTPQETEEPYYQMRPFRLYFTAYDGILMFGDSPETVKKSETASKNRFHRFTPKRESDGKNVVMARLGKEMTADFIDDVFSNYDAEISTAEPLTLEGNILFVPGGWDLELFTNMVSVFYGKEFEEHMYVKPAGDFFSVGGGQLLAALDSTPNLQQITGGRYASFLNDLFGSGLRDIRQILEEKLGSNKTDELYGALLAIDRINVAATKNPERTADFRAYIHLASRTEGAMAKAGEILLELLQQYNDYAATAEKGEPLFQPVSVPGWKSVYTLPIPDLEKTPFDQALSFAVGENAILLGLLPPSLLAEPFSSESKLYGEIIDRGDLMEKIYIDLRSIRKSMKPLLESAGLSRSDRRMLATLLVPFADFHEIGAQTFSSRHMLFNFRTGWLDFDDRATLRMLMR